MRRGAPVLLCRDAACRVSALLLAASASAAVTITQDARDFRLSNGPITAQVSRASGELVRLSVGGTELLGGQKGYWSWVGDSEDEEIGGRDRAADSFLRIDPATNRGARGEVAVVMRYAGRRGQLPLDVEFRYALEERSGDLAVTAVLRHDTNHPALRLGEARYALKLDGRLFDYMAIDEARRGLMPSGADWDAGKTMNLGEVRQIRTGPLAGKVEHKYSYSAILADTPAYGWASTGKRLGVWLVNPSAEYLAGGPTKVELTAHLDVNRGGAPTLLNMWLGSHYGGSAFALTNGQVWRKQIGPFFLRLNGGAEPETLWREAQQRARLLQGRWPYAWAEETPAPRGALRGRLVLRDPLAPGAALTNLRVGLVRPGADWQRDGLGYQFWAAATNGSFVIPQVRPGTYTLHAFATDVLGDFTRAEVVVTPGRTTEVGALDWVPERFGPTVWQLGTVDRTAAEFRHGNDYWKWGRYLKYASEFSNGVDFVIGQSDLRRDWNYCQPARQDGGWGNRDSVQRIRFPLDAVPAQPLTLRLAFCGARGGCEVVVLANEREAGRTGRLPESSVMHRDGIRGYWFERRITLAPALLRAGENVLTLRLRARAWHEGVLYDAIRLEGAGPGAPPAR